MEEADELCDRVAIIDKGMIVALDEPSILKKTLGGKSSIRIRVKGSQAEDAKKLLTEFNPTLMDDELQISVKDPWGILTHVSEILSSERILTEKIEVVEPTLEDVFVNLTGRKLKEGEAA